VAAALVLLIRQWTVIVIAYLVVAPALLVELDILA